MNIEKTASSVSPQTFLCQAGPLIGLDRFNLPKVSAGKTSFHQVGFSLNIEKLRMLSRHSLSKGHNVNVNIVVLNYQTCNQCLKCQVSGHKSLGSVIDKSLDLEKSREEITPFFLASSRKLDFHFSFYSRFSRFLEKNSLSLLDL